MTKQPIWKMVTTLGKCFVYIDETGIYEAEACHLERREDQWTAYRFILERCTYDRENDILSDNKYHPEICAWFWKPRADMQPLAGYTGVSVDDLIESFCSEDPVERAYAYRAVGQYYGKEYK